ncbi:MAG: EamA family transporter [Actinobacteria bacterium]|nr:EamA family transporter [Actinomycetota bacterium]
MRKRESPTASSVGWIGLAAVAAAATLWAVAAAAARTLFDDGVEPLELVQARAYVAAIGLALVPAAWKKPRTSRLWSVIALGVAIALVNAFYYVAIERLAVAVALVLQYTGPAVVVAWVALTTRKRPAPQILLALAATFAGVVLVSELLGGDIGSLDVIGIACGLGSAVMFATYTLLSERTSDFYGVIGALFRGFCAASILWLVFQIPQGWPHALTASENLPRVLFVGVAGTLAPFLLYLWGVERIRAERAVIAATLEPVVAGVVAWIWLGQLLTPMQLIGGSIIVAAVASLQMRRSEPAPVVPG